MRQHLNPVAQATYDMYYSTAIKGGCDEMQAHGIAREKTLSDVMRTSATLHAQREKMQGFLE